MLFEQDLKDPILLKVHGSNLVVVDNYVYNKKMKGLGSMKGWRGCRHILGQFSNLSVYRNHLVGLLKQCWAPPHSV